MKLAVRIVFSLVLITSVSASGQRAMSDVVIKVHHVRGPIYMLEGNGGNIGVSAGEDGLLIVDDQFAPLAEKIRAALKGIDDGELQFVLNTHHHADHVGGNADFGRDAPIVAHTNVRKRLSRPRNHKKESLPVITFNDSLSIHFNGEEIRLVHFPNGHTDSDSVIFFTESNVVHMGDLLFTGSFPSFYTSEGGDIIQYAKNVEAVMELLEDDTKIIAGHGVLATLRDVQEFHAMLIETTDIVRRQLDAGKTLEEVSATGLPEKYDRWVSPFTSVEQWVAKVYRNLAP